jgi:hypothetical protein
VHTLVSHEHKRWWVYGHDSFDVLGYTRIAAVAIKRPEIGRSSGQEDKVSAGRTALERYPLRVNGQTNGIRTEPSQRGFDVVDLGWPGGFRREAVLRRDTDITLGSDSGREGPHHLAAATTPTATMDQHQGWRGRL